MRKSFIFIILKKKKKMENECTCGETTNPSGACDGFGSYICDE
ncbi:MAG: hypothetical protein ACON4B_07410 [Flavobacteriaceae bacterium]